MNESSHIIYKEALAKLPESALEFADLARQLKNAAKEWKRAKKNGDKKDIEIYAERIMEIEIKMEEHARRS